MNTSFWKHNIIKQNNIYLKQNMIVNDHYDPLGTELGL